MGSLLIVSKTWNKNSFGLFDYESRDIQKKSLRAQGTCTFSVLTDSILGKLMRNEVIKDTVDIETVNEALYKPDTPNTPNTPKETQMARLFHRKGNICQELSMA